MARLRHLFANRRLQLLLLAAIPLALFFYARSVLSWRPRVLGPVKGTVGALAWSPDGNFIAALANNDDGHGKICIYDIVQQRQVSVINHSAGFDTLDSLLHFSPDNRTIYASDGERRLRRWQIESGKEINSARLEIVGMGFTLSPDGSIFVHNDEFIMARHTSNGKILWQINDPYALISLARFSLDGKKLALLLSQSALSEKPVLAIWDVTSPKTRVKPEYLIPISPRELLADDMLFNKQQNVVHLWGLKGFVSSYDLPSRHIRARLEMPWVIEPHASLLPGDSVFALIACTDPNNSNYIRLREWPSNKIQRVLRTRNQGADFVLPTFSPDGATLAVFDGNANSIILWRIR